MIAKNRQRKGEEEKKMYQCKSCGGNLEFDIESQKLKCKYCSTLFDPYEVTKESDGYEEQTFEATYFACPNCGGEIYSTDNAAAGFCSFCGASTVLSSRIERELMPDGIIPFQITKEDCKKRYLSRVKKLVFAPKYMKNPESIESFRGIYMPYWKYQYTVNGEVSMPAHREHRSGDYIITDHYRLSGDVNAAYNGFTFDASSSFNDNISEEIAPYEVRAAKTFTPSMLSGFYADVADVPQDVYQKDAENKAKDSVAEAMKQNPEFAGLTVEKDKMDCPQQLKSVDRMMFPVWFMSYRDKDRVAYVTLNGQTGKMSADIPVDHLKFMIFSLILAVPIFFLLNALPVLPFQALLFVSTLFGTLTACIFTYEISMIVRRNTDERNRGMLWKQGKLNTARQGNKNVSDAYENQFASVMSIVIIGGILCGVGAVISAQETGVGLVVIGYFIEFVIVLCMFFFVLRKAKKYKVSGKFSLLYTLFTYVVAFFITAIEPASDIAYYAGVILVLVGILANLLIVISNYNKTVTRPLPQFNKRGGNDRA